MTPAKARLRRVGTAFAFTVLATFGGTALVDSPRVLATVGAPVDAGDVVIVRAENHSKHLDHAGSATEFSLRLPEGSTCPGDTQNDDWRIQSFVVPAGVDLGTLQYGVIGPVGTAQYALYDIDTHPFADASIPSKSGPDAPALVGAPPPYSFALFPPGTLPDGHYRIGLACTYFRKTAKYWDTEIIVSNTAADQPAHFTWSLATLPATAPDQSQGASRVWLVLVATGVAGGAGAGAFLWRRSNRRVTNLLKEPS